MTPVLFWRHQRSWDKCGLHSMIAYNMTGDMAQICLLTINVVLSHAPLGSVFVKGVSVLTWGMMTIQNLSLFFRATLSRAVRLPQWRTAVYPLVLGVWRLDSMRWQERRDGLSSWVNLNTLHHSRNASNTAPFGHLALPKQFRHG